MDKKEQISKFLAENKINFNVIYLGETERDDWECDAWRTEFSSPSGSAEFDYRTGLGHRKANKAKPPHAVDVLQCLILDSAANDSSFNYWCSDYGYNPDSIRAFNTYQACCKTSDDLRKIFTRSQLSEIKIMLEDY